MAPLDPLHFPPVAVDWPAPWHYAPMLLWIPACYIGYRIFRTLFALLKAVFIYLICPIFYKPDLSKYENRWTVVTGGTDGIGKAYMYELANRGLSKFVVIGRSPSKMNDVKTYLELNHNCRVKTFQFDFMYDDYAKLSAFLSDIDIGFVVNSVGVGREVMERYGDNCPADHQILRVNGLGSADFMAMVLQPMERHGGGQIVCLSSSQGYRPIPYLAAYCASKTMLSFLCEAIHREYSTINVQCLTPALIATKMTYYKNGGLFVATPEAFCREAVNTLGITWKTSGCFNHEFQMLLMHLFPWSVLKYLIMPIYYFHKRRVIKLHAQEAQEKMTLTRATA